MRRACAVAISEARLEHTAYDVASPTTESRAQARSAPSAVKASVKPEAWCESTRRFAPKTASGRCIRTPMTSAEPHMRRVTRCTMRPKRETCASPAE